MHARDLVAEVIVGKFEVRLLRDHRIAMHETQMPPIRNLGDDLSDIAGHFTRLPRKGMQFLIRIPHVRQIEKWLRPVERPNDVVTLLHRKPEHTGSGRRHWPPPGFYTGARLIVFVLVKETLQIVADDLALGQVHAKVRAIRTQHRRFAILAAEHHDPATE